ncbi:MAG TPA: dienelactone hydrolase family protein [Candidatus Binataceae bacterium]|nr:dienelactone hydrolase family protein [Candidatus Binataceae bacterium]
MNPTTVSIRATDGSSFSAYLAAPASGSGPGLILLHEIFGVNRHIRELADLYAEEGYFVLAPDLFWRLKPGIELGYSSEDVETGMTYYRRFDIDHAILDIGDAIATLRNMPGCNGKVAALGFSLGGRLALLAAARLPIEAAVSNYGLALEENIDEAVAARCPIALHFAAADKYVPSDTYVSIKRALAENDEAEIYVYPGAGHGFHNRARDTFHSSSVSLAHSRTISLLRRTIGPRYNLEALWEKHLEGEFVTCDADATIRTMVPNAYVNHVPTMIGGLGTAQLHRYYKYHFIPENQGSTLIPVSRTIGADRLVDEFVACFKHDHFNHTLLPGIAPTGKEVRLPLVAIVQFRGDKLCAEHLYWDQASLLAQVGILDKEKLPITGAEAADCVLDHELPLNTLRAEAWWKSSEGKD